jgi:hypothetical protein
MKFVLNYSYDDGQRGQQKAAYFSTLSEAVAQKNEFAEKFGKNWSYTISSQIIIEQG